MFSYKLSYFLEPHNHIKNKIKVELGLSNYDAKSYFISTTGVHRSDADLASLKSDVDDLAINKSKTVPVDLSKLRNVVKKLLLNRICEMNCLKRLMLFRLFILIIQVK